MASETTNPDPLLPTPDAAAFMGLQAGTLEVWRTTKRYALPYVKVGRKVLYRRSALEAFLKSREVA